MIIRLTDDFRKQYKKANKRIKKSFDQRLIVFIKNPMDSELRNHSLRDKWEGHRSIDITADWRAIYRNEGEVDRETIIYFTALGTHKQLYTQKNGIN